MNKKILVVSILTILMLVTISFATAVTSNTNTTNSKKKESPLFKIRTELAIGEKLQNLKETIKAKFLGERLFFLPFQWLRNRKELSDLFTVLYSCTHDTSYPVPCTSGGKLCITCQCQPNVRRTLG
ncbi:MAG: hypothetical protein QHH19_06390, partial [Candidatus Thermoplasmatota archaeon]|jgi:hypothetical protein|nr:hypothetical protein [Candidatus Thermoplasmatota archaeon]